MNYSEIVAELEDAMSDISEDCYAASWMNGLEFDLWALVVGDREDYGWCDAARLVAPIQALRELSSAAGFWLQWIGDDNDPNSGPSPILLEEWRKVYAARKETS